MNNVPDRIVFAHMLKTAGTSFTKKLAQHYGLKFHITQGGSYLSEEPLDAISLEHEIQRVGDHVRVVSGHNLRPHMFLGSSLNRVGSTQFRTAAG